MPVSVKKCQEEKDLGVKFDKKLTFDNHIQYIGKANKMLGITCSSSKSSGKTNIQLLT